MNLIFFKYVLPILLGYTIFVAIAGQYTPFRPVHEVRRPLWFLGLWTGICAAVITIAGLHLAYQMDLNELSTLVPPGLVAVCFSMLPGIIGFLWYHWRIKRDMRRSSAVLATSDIDTQEFAELDNTLASDALINQASDDSETACSIEVPDTQETHAIWAENSDNLIVTELGMDDSLSFEVEPANANEPTLVIQNESNLINDSNQIEHESYENVGQADDDLNELTDSIDPLTMADAESVSVIDTDPESDADAEPTLTVDPNTVDSTDMESQVVDDASQQNISHLTEAEAEDHSDWADVEKDHDTKINTMESAAHLCATEDIIALAQATAELTDSKQEIIRLRNELQAEINDRKELETHLRITRNGLGALESESREFESNKAAVLIEMERELEEKVKRTSAAEARADRETAKRVELENEMVQLREDALKASTDCRVSTEARANALSTANRATTMARQAMQIRARLESQLKDAKDEIDSKQSTISSLIKALEKEKSRTQDDVASMAKQLRLHEKQLQARRTLEEVSRSVDNKLSNRLVKKVAKSRG